MMSIPFLLSLTSWTKLLGNIPSLLLTLPSQNPCSPTPRTEMSSNSSLYFIIFHSLKKKNYNLAKFLAYLDAYKFRIQYWNFISYNIENKNFNGKQNMK